MKFSEKLFLLRKQKALTQAELAEKIGVSRQAVSKWEMGTAAPELANIVALSSVFHVPIEELVAEKENSGFSEKASAPNAEPEAPPQENTTPSAKRKASPPASTLPTAKSEAPPPESPASSKATAPPPAAAWKKRIFVAILLLLLFVAIGLYRNALLTMLSLYFLICFIFISVCAVKALISLTKKRTK